MSKAKAPIDPMARLKELEDEQAKLFADFEQKLKEQRAKALADIIQPLKDERIELCQTVNDANSRISEIDRELAKLEGKTVKPKATGGKRNRRTPAEMEAEKREIAAAGTKLFAMLKKAGKGEQLKGRDLKAEVLGANVGKALQPYVDAGLVALHPNPPHSSYSYLKDGSIAAE